MKIKILLILCTCMIFTSCVKQEKESLIRYVNPMVGTARANMISSETGSNNTADYGQTIPAVTAPFGMTQWTLQNMETENKCVSPFYLGKNGIDGFRASHWLNGSCTQDYGSFTIMPVSGVFNHNPKLRRSDFLIDFDTFTPAYCAVQIPIQNVITEITATKRCGFFRFSWINAENPTLIFDVNSDEGEGYIKVIPESREIVAFNPVHRIYNGKGKPAGFSGYMVARLDCEISGFATFSEQEIFRNIPEKERIPGVGTFVHLKPGPGDVVKVKIGTSFTSIEKARENLEKEIPDWDFEEVKQNLERVWEDLLGQIRIEGSSADESKKFYTALYHSCFHPRLFSDVDGTFKGFDGDTLVHKAEGFDYYTDFSAWDTYRAQMPLLSLIAPKAYEDMVKSLIVMSEQGGWLPVFPMWNSYTSAMIGDHCISIIGDAFMKGFRFDVEKAWLYMKKNAFKVPDNYEDYVDGKGRRSLRSYMEYGYIPLEDEVLEAFHKREQVSRTLEYAYDDWVLAQVADGLGHDAESRELKARALNYTNVFDPSRGWVCGRFTDGSFTSEFNLQGDMPYITEGTPQHYSFYVPQDVPGLIHLMGGKPEFLRKLQELFDTKEYWHGNEPCHHIPYLYNYADRWDLTQKTVKNILKSEYDATAGGLPGNDDAGQMSAWYVFSSMGFYPVCPGSNEYQLSSPVFQRINLSLDKRYYPGRKLIIEAKGTPPGGVFSSVSLNGRKFGTTMNHSLFKKGGKLVFSM